MTFSKLFFYPILVVVAPFILVTVINYTILKGIIVLDPPTKSGMILLCGIVLLEYLILFVLFFELFLL